MQPTLVVREAASSCNSGHIPRGRRDKVDIEAHHSIIGLTHVPHRDSTELALLVAIVARRRGVGIRREFSIGRAVPQISGIAKIALVIL